MITISEASSSISATTSWISVRTMRFFNRASVVGADQTISRFAPRKVSTAGSLVRVGEAASCATILLSTSATRASA
jgi:hypothetical protein